MRRIAILVVLSLLLIQSSPVSTQPFGPLQPRPPAILNGCNESELFAVLSTDAGKYCLGTLLPKFGNVTSTYSLFCSDGKWGCCIKTAGLASCKVEGAIPYRRTMRPPAALDPR